MPLAVDIAVLAAVAQVDEQLGTLVTGEARHVPQQQTVSVTIRQLTCRQSHLTALNLTVALHTHLDMHSNHRNR